MDPVYTSVTQSADGGPLFRIYEYAGDFMVTYARVGDFRIDKRTGEVAITDRVAGAESTLQAVQRGAITAFSGEIAGDPVLHASGVLVGRKAVLFAGEQQAGKTTLATMFVKAGYGFVTDDVARIGFRNPGFLLFPTTPELKLWPENAERVFGHTSYPRVHPGTTKLLIRFSELGDYGYVSTPVEIQRVYVVDRFQPNTDAAQVEIDALTPGEALIALNRHSYALRIATKLGFQQSRLRVLADFASRTPVKRLRYPSGHEYFSKIRDAIEEDCEIRA